MTLHEAESFAALRCELERTRAELRITKAQVKQAMTCGYNRALRRLARKPTGALLTATYRQGRHGMDAMDKPAIIGPRIQPPKGKR